MLYSLSDQIARRALLHFAALACAALFFCARHWFGLKAVAASIQRAPAGDIRLRGGFIFRLDDVQMCL